MLAVIILQETLALASNNHQLFFLHLDSHSLSYNILFVLWFVLFFGVQKYYFFSKY